MRKVILLVSIVTICFSCGNIGNKEQIKQITVIGENAATIQALMSLGAQYEAQNKGIKIDFRPNTFEDAFTKSNQDFANGTGLYDIVLQYNFALSSFVRNRYVSTPDEFFKSLGDSLKLFEKDIFKNAWLESGYYYKDPQKPTAGITKVGYPIAANSMVLMYNKDLFEDVAQQTTYKRRYGKDLKVPTTWEDFIQVAAFFTQSDKGFHGVCLQGAAGGWLYYEFVNFLFGMGGKVMDKQYGWEGNERTPVLLNSPAALKALQYYIRLKPYNAGNFSNVDQSEQMNLLKAGKAAMGFVWTDVLYPSVGGTPNFDRHFGFAPIPGNVSILSGCSIFVSRKSKNPETAFKYVIDLMQPKTQVELARKGLCSPLKTAYEDSEVKKLPYTAALRESLSRGVYTLEAGPDATMISEKMTTYIQKAWNGQLSPPQALMNLQSEVVSERNKIFQQIK